MEHQWKNTDTIGLNIRKMLCLGCGDESLFDPLTGLFIGKQPAPWCHHRSIIDMTNWIYIQTEPNLFTVGFYSPDGAFHGDSDYPTRELAAKRVHYLNGGK